MNATPDFKRISAIEPVIKADELAFVVFKRKDAAEMSRFLLDFGFVPLDDAAGPSLYFRAQGQSPYCVEIIPSDQDGYVGAGFIAASEADLQTLSAASGRPIEDIEKPGGGKRVTLTDPDGSRVDVIYGFTPAPSLGKRDTLIPANTPKEKRRINAEVRTPVEPTAIDRIGHVVLFTPDYSKTSDWYSKWLGALHTDVLTDASGTPCASFMRLNRGDKPADHHNLAVFASDHVGVHHVSTEAVDIDAIGQGQQYLMHKGWQHFWGIGRHLLGSQIFDYWLDPTGLEWEHYADGDVMTVDYETGYHLVGRYDLWAWGDDLPAVTKPAPGTIENAPAHIKGLLVEWDKPARPWIP